MPSPFDADFDAADDLFAEVFGVSVGIQRGGNSVTTATAEPVMLDHAVTEFESLKTSTQPRHYLIAAAEYRVGGEAVEPRVGDRITEIVNGVACTFEVMPPSGRPEFEWADTNGTRLLVHCQRVE